MKPWNQLGKFWKALGGFEPRSGAPSVHYAISLVASPDRNATLAHLMPPGWVLLSVTDRQSAVELTGSLGAPVVICDCESEGVDWRSLMWTLSRYPYRASCLLIAPKRTTALVADAIQHGGYEVVEQPLERALFQRLLAGGEWHAQSQRNLDHLRAAS